MSAASAFAGGVLAVVYQLMRQPQPHGLIAGGLVLVAGLATCAYDVGVVKKDFQHEHLTKVINLSVRRPL
jgi:UDP-N-acetylmuramyl pentapeptide phosphotransferase/UDP-N-acetylglucosamine-1-phosphate transferase